MTATKTEDHFFIPDRFSTVASFLESRAEADAAQAKAKQRTETVLPFAVLENQEMKEERRRALRRDRER